MAMSGASTNHSPKPGVSSPWSQIVAAVAPPHSPSPPPAIVDSSAVNSATAEDSDNASDGHNGNTVKRPVWKKPSDAGSSSVMGADDSWPTLYETLSSPPDLVKSSGDSSSPPLLQGTGSTLPSPQRQVGDDASVNNMNPAPTTHQKPPFKRSNSSLSSNGGHPPQLPVPQVSMPALPGSYGHNSSPKDHQPRAGFVPNDHPQHRNSFRNRNGGPHHRGDSAHHRNYGNRRDQDRGNQDWNTHRNFNGRDNYMPPRFGGPRMMRPPSPPNPAHLFPPPPPPMRPFGSTIGFPELPPQMVYVPPTPLESLRGGPFGPPMPPNAMYFSPPDPQLYPNIVKQIDYYFSNENLVKDIYLRKNMDDQGWVPINLIAGFKKVKHLTENIQYVLDAVRTSSAVEVQGDKIRRRNDWERWIMVVPTQFPNAATSQSVGQLAEKVQSITLETTNNDAAGGLDVSHSRPLNSQYMLSTGEGSSQVGIQVSDPSIKAKN